MMNPYISWALLLVVAGSLGWYYNGPNSKAKNPVKPAVEKSESATGIKKPKKKAKKSPEPTSSTTTKKVEEKPAFEYKASEGDDRDEEIDQKEMAKRFAAVKSGIPAQVSGSEGKSQKKKKKTVSQLEAEASERSGSRVSTRTSSTAGADADDDLSPAGSPMVKPTASSAGYVSDMLEAPAPGASVLRVTGFIEEPQKKQKAQSFKQVETKKQRQQRQKNEARKQQVQEAEAERRKLLEKQLHMAREAERREAAKSKPVAPQTNAWQTKDMKPASNGTPNVSQSPNVDLLDTFEAPSAKQAPATASSSKKWDQGLPSEEEQMRILGADPVDDWTTVSSKKTKKKGGKADESVSEASASETQPTPVAHETVPAAPKVTVTPTYIPDILRSKQKGHPLDSDWAA